MIQGLRISLVDIIIVYLLLILHRGKIGCCKEFHDYSTQGQDVKVQMLYDMHSDKQLNCI